MTTVTTAASTASGIASASNSLQRSGSANDGAASMNAASHSGVRASPAAMLVG